MMNLNKLKPAQIQDSSFCSYSALSKKPSRIVKFETVFDALDLQEGEFIAGGSALSYFLGENIDFDKQDVDVYFHSAEHCKAFINRIHDQSKSVVSKMSNQEYLGATYRSTLIIMDPIWDQPRLVMLNLIDFGYGTPEEVINRFDFTCCQFAVDHNKKLYTGPNAVQDATDRRIEFVDFFETFNSRKEFYINDVNYTEKAAHIHAVRNVENRLSKYQNRGFDFGDSVAIAKLLF